VAFTAFAGVAAARRGVALSQVEGILK
jgi:hypothetical protein